MSVAGAPVDPSRCPLCGKANACAMELERRTGQPQPPCWCSSAPVTRDLVAAVPAPAQGLACVCADCVRRAGA